MKTIDLKYIYPEECKKPCHKCVHFNYDSFHDEYWCPNFGHLIDPGGTCDKWESFNE